MRLIIFIFMLSFVIDSVKFESFKPFVKSTKLKRKKAKVTSNNTSLSVMSG